MDKKYAECLAVCKLTNR